MNSLSPTAQGFRLIFRRPAIPLAEIAWRWSFVAAAWTLTLLFLFEYMDSLPVSRVERLLLGTGQPVFVSRALHRIFRGSAFRFTEAGILVAIGLAVAWVVLASLGRAAIVDSVAEEFGVTHPARRRGILSSLSGLNFLRVAVTLAAGASCIGAMLLSSSFWASTHVSAADASRLFILILFCIWLAWIVLNWFLSVSTIFVVSDGSSALAAVASMVRLCQQKPVAVLTASILFGLAHLGAFVTASIAGVMLFGTVGGFSPRLLWFGQFLLIAAYCAVADFLYTGRLAAYTAIIHGKETEVTARPDSVLPVTPTDSSSVDRDEVILSDVPVPAT